MQDTDKLLSAVKSADLQTRLDAIKSLADHKTAVVVQRLIALRQDDNWQVRRAAEDALRRIDTPEARAAIEDTAPRPDVMMSSDKANELFRRIQGITGEQWVTGESPAVGKQSPPPEEESGDDL